MFDVFYWGNKPNLFAFEKPAASLDDAAAQSKTSHYWYIYGGNDYANFDFDIVPVPWEANHIYVYPSQWQPDGGVYLANKLTVQNLVWNFRNEQKVKRMPNMTQWQIPNNIDTAQFDFSWHPNAHEPAYEYHFPTQHQPAGGPVYSGTAGVKLVTDQTAVACSNTAHWIIPSNIDDSEFDYSWHPNPVEPNYEYHFGTQWRNAGGPVYPGTAGIKFVSSQRVTALADMSRWTVPAGIDTSEFDFSWHPDPFEPAYEYRFPSQHQRDGGPVYRGTAGIKYETEQKILANATQIFYMDFLNPESEDQFQLLQQEFPDIKRTRYVSDHLNVMRRIANMATTEFVWVISSICDYNFFDFTWHPPKEQREMIHCFANGGVFGKTGAELRGDTFYIHVPSFKTQMVELELLDWFNVINYITDCRVERWSVPAVHYTGDNLIEAIKAHTFTTPYTMFTNDRNLASMGNFNTCLWTEKDRVARDLSLDRSTSLIPRDIKQYIKTQVYDYPYLDATKTRNVRHTPDLDIVYISNGEPDEERWYENACYQSNREVKWIRGVDGRVAAYQAAAQASTTDWFLTVFAKLEVLGSEFDWHWQPDYWQGPKHYIFNARNPVNGLEYGHMGMIAYNKRLVLENNTPGIDFTLSQPHESVPVLSGTAHFNQDAWTTWRTAFREVLKLRLFMATQPTLETEHRLNTWLTQAQGNYSNYCLDGARDAVEYYEEVGGDPAQLQLSFEWSWLRARYDAKY